MYLAGEGPVFALSTFSPDEPINWKDRWYLGFDELLDG